MASQPPPPVVFLRGQRVYLRPLELGDVDRAQRWLNEPDTRANLTMYWPITRRREEEFITQATSPGTEVHLAIVLVDGDRHVGALGLRDIRWKDRTADLGIVIGEPDARDQGYGREALQLLLRYSFDDLNLNKLCLWVYDFNARGIHVYEKLGFVHEGTMRAQSYIAGRYVDHHVYGLLASDWRASRG